MDVLYQAKRLDNGQWIFGRLVKTSHQNAGAAEYAILQETSEQDIPIAIPIDAKTAILLSGKPHHKSNTSVFQGDTSQDPLAPAKTEEDIRAVVDRLLHLMGFDSTHADPFKAKAATGLLHACCFYLLSECSPEERNLISVQKLLRCGLRDAECPESTLDILMNLLKEKNSDHSAVLSYRVFKSCVSVDTEEQTISRCLDCLQRLVRHPPLSDY